MRLKCKISTKKGSLQYPDAVFFNTENFIRKRHPDIFFPKKGKAIAKNIIFAFADDGMDTTFHHIHPQ